MYTGGTTRDLKADQLIAKRGELQQQLVWIERRPQRLKGGNACGLLKGDGMAGSEVFPFPPSNLAFKPLYFAIVMFHLGGRLARLIELAIEPCQAGPKLGNRSAFRRFRGMPIEFVQERPRFAAFDTVERGINATRQATVQMD